MNERTLQENLATVLQDLADGVIQDEEGEEYGVLDVRTFESVGMLTMNKGLVVRLTDGSEFQLTIVQSK